MAYYLHICKDKNDELFLLISEQKADSMTMGIQIKAQIYFSHPPTKLEQTDTPLEVVTFPISKKEVEHLLDLAQTRKTANTTVGLFARGKINKNDPFRVFSFPTTQKISDLLEMVDIKLPKKSMYTTHTVTQDPDHELENKHSLIWKALPNITTRMEVNQKDWAPIEHIEANLLYKLSIIQNIFENHSSKIDNQLAEKYTKFLEDLQGYGDQTENLANDVKSGNPEAKKLYLQSRKDLLGFIEYKNDYFINELSSQSSLGKLPELKRAQFNAVPEPAGRAAPGLN